jgi:hypothetical protein
MTNWKECSGDGTQDSGLKPRDPRLLAALPWSDMMMSTLNRPAPCAPPEPDLLVSCRIGELQHPRKVNQPANLGYGARIPNEQALTRA